MTQQAPAADVSPLDVLVGLMRRRWAEDNTEEAVLLAKAAAPYVHARPSGAAAARPTRLLSQVTDAELDEWIGDGPADPGA